MRSKKACLIINPRAGQNVTRVTDLIAIFSAAGWRTDIALKGYAGQVLKLAARAAKKKYDLLIAYGGDGTLNKVVNGVLNARGQSIIGAIPGGTANEWAVEVGLPLDPVHAALTLINSDARTIDLGSMRVQGLVFPHTAQPASVQQPEPTSKGKKIRKKRAQEPSRAKQRFVLMAGLGTDASIIPYISKSLKYQAGSRAFEVAAAKKLAELRPFPVEIGVVNDAGGTTLLWRGEAWQVLIANARLYGSIVDIAPQAYLDDERLDICVITAGDLIATIGQITSLLLRRKPDDETAQYFQGEHFYIRVPASIGMHLDGSLIKLKDHLSKAEREALQHETDLTQVTVEYRFDSEPRAVQVAIPRIYEDTLFKKSIDEEEPQAVLPGIDAGRAQQHENRFEERQRESPELVNALLERGRRVTVVGVAPNPQKKDTYIIAGALQNQMAGDTRPVAMSVDDTVTLINRAGEHLAPAALQELPEGAVIAIEGKKSRRGVIRAARILV